MRWNLRIAAIAALVIAGIWQMNDEEQAPKPAPAPTVAAVAPTKHALVTPAKAVAPQAIRRSPAREMSHDKELRGLEDMSRTLSEYTQGQRSYADLLSYREKSHQEPVVAKDSNPATGDMMVVRTKSPLPGTRYFHAQYFNDENGVPFPQHMSFEFRPGVQSMAEAIAYVQRTFSGLKSPVIQKDDFIKWDLDGDYVVWIKKMAAQDLRDDPFNAYTSSDVGTVRVAVEQDIHGE